MPPPAGLFSGCCYLAELLELAELPCIDAIAHIGYTRRYMKKAGFDLPVDMAHYGDELDTLLRRMRDRGLALEVNTSGLRNPDLGETIPGADVIRRWRALGGERITLGSDAHTVADAGGGLREGLALIRDCGFAWLTVFRERKAEFIKI